MKNQNKAKIPAELMGKLKKWATSELSKDELAVLNAVLGVYYLGIQKKSVVLEDYPEYLNEVAAASPQAESEVDALITPVTPTTTTVTITTTIASHPIITCKD